MKTTSFACPNCGAALKAEAGKSMYRCDYCGSSLTMPKEIFHDLNDTEELLREREEKDLLDKNDEYGEKVYKGHRHIWRIQLGVYLSFVAFLIAMMEENASEYLRSFWPSFFFFGLIFIVAARPEEYMYYGYVQKAMQKKAFFRMLLWRCGMFAWAALMSIFWGFPNVSLWKEQMFNNGMVLLIIGVILLMVFRPSSYRRKLLGDKGRRRYRRKGKGRKDA